MGKRLCPLTFHCIKNMPRALYHARSSSSLKHHLTPSHFYPTFIQQGFMELLLHVTSCSRRWGGRAGPVLGLCFLLVHCYSLPRTYRAFLPGRLFLNVPARGRSLFDAPLDSVLPRPQHLEVWGNCPFCISLSCLRAGDRIGSH